MARSTLTDYLQNYPFWLMDVAPIEPLALPLFTPLLGFSSITAPEITVDIEPIPEGNWYFTRKVMARADVGNITLSRASKWYDSDFYKWMMAALAGDTGGYGVQGSMAIGGTSPRRDLLLIHFMARSPLPSGVAQVAAATGTLALQGASTSMAAVSRGVAGPGFTGGSRGYVEHANAITGAAAASGLSLNLGPFEFTPRLPAKAWMLYGCIPARYRPASDFDALDSAISLQELEVAVEQVEEISLGSEAAPIALGVAVANASR